MDKLPVIVRNDVVVDSKQGKSKHYARKKGCEWAVISVKNKVVMDLPEKILPVDTYNGKICPCRAPGIWDPGQSVIDRLIEGIERHETLPGASCFKTP